MIILCKIKHNCEIIVLHVIQSYPKKFINEIFLDDVGNHTFLRIPFFIIWELSEILRKIVGWEREGILNLPMEFVRK